MLRIRVARAPCAWAALAILTCRIVQPFALSQTRVAEERDLKAVFLVNFARYVEWPAGSPQTDPHRPLRIGILGRGPFGKAVDAAASGVTIRGRAIIVERLQDVTRAVGYNVIFISGSEAGHAAEHVPVLNQSGALTVSDSDDVARHGVAITLMNEQEHVRFAVNLTATRIARLTIGSELLRLARSIEGQP